MEMRKLSCQETEELLPEYALGALSASEAADVAQHMAACPAHVSSLEDYRAACDVLCASVPSLTPPAQLRTRLLDKVWPRFTTRPARRAARWRGALAAAAAVAALALGAWGLSLQGELARREAQFDRFQKLVSDPATRMIPLATESGGGSAKGVLFLSHSEAAIWAIGLPRLDSDEVFACWWIDQDDHPVSGGAFTPREDAAVWFIPMPVDAAEYSAFGITLEPNGQSADPQGPRVMAAEF